jgi:hypothetical protein
MNRGSLSARECLNKWATPPCISPTSEATPSKLRRVTGPIQRFPIAWPGCRRLFASCTQHTLCEVETAPFRHASGVHVLVSWSGLDKGPMDEANAFGLELKTITIAGTYFAALVVDRASELSAAVPGRHSENLRAADRSNGVNRSQKHQSAQFDAHDFPRRFDALSMRQALPHCPAIAI